MSNSETQREDAKEVEECKRRTKTKIKRFQITRYVDRKHRLFLHMNDSFG